MHVLRANRAGRSSCLDRLTALFLAAGVVGALGVGLAQPWHRHLLEGLQLFHHHSDLGSHHHEEFHALAESTHGPRAGLASDEHAPHDPGHGGEPEEDDARDIDCTLIGGSPTSLERSSEAFTEPMVVAQRREALRPTALRVRDPASSPGARAPPA